MSSEAIVIRNLRKSFRQGLFGQRMVRALQGIDLRVQQGEAWALAGPNGAGKTTTMHCLLGLVLADSGEVTIAGQSPSLPASRRRVGFASEVFFTYAALPAGDW